jgi:hypothetical protein
MVAGGRSPNVALGAHDDPLAKVARFWLREVPAGPQAPTRPTETFANAETVRGWCSYTDFHHRGASTGSWVFKPRPRTVIGLGGFEVIAGSPRNCWRRGSPSRRAGRCQRGIVGLGSDRGQPAAAIARFAAVGQGGRYFSVFFPPNFRRGRNVREDGLGARLDLQLQRPANTDISIGCRALPGLRQRRHGPRSGSLCPQD